MLRRLALSGAQRYFGGPGKSWVITSGILLFWRGVTSMTGRRETLDLSNTKPGDKIVIEHLPITHKTQIRQFKKEKKVEKALVKTKKRTAKSAPNPEKSSRVLRTGQVLNRYRNKRKEKREAKALKASLKANKRTAREDKRDARAAKRDAKAARRDRRQARKVERHKERVAERSEKLVRRAVRLEQRAARTADRASKLN
jgi:hypothetical protein